MKKLLITIAAVFLLHSSQIYCQSEFDPVWAERFQQVLDSVRIAQNRMGAVAAVYAPGEGIWSGISGNSTPTIPLTPEMRLGIGSNTKLFIAVTIMKLQENGLLSLDDPLSQWLPTYPNIDSTITIRQLLLHQSGIYNITDNSNFYSAIYADTAHFWTAQEVLGYVLAPSFEPGSAWSYSNTNYILAGMIIESVTGDSWVQKVHEFIFDPLNMDSTFVGGYEPPNGPIAAFRKWTNTPPWFTYPVTSYFSAFGAAGAIFSTPAEMVQWYKALIEGEIVTNTSLLEILDFDPSSHFGLGITGDADISLTYPCFNHGGQVFNFLSQVIYDLKTQSVFCIMVTNYPSDIPFQYPFVNAMMPVLYSDYPKKQNDAGIPGIIGPTSHLCNDAVVPQIILKNYGTDPLTTANIQYNLDDEITINYTWTGTLNPDDSAIVTLEPSYTSEGLHRLKVFSSLPNNEQDGYLYNDTMVMNFVKSVSTSITLPYEEHFENPGFPPQDWISYPDVFTNWGRTSIVSYSGNSCAVKCNYWDFNHIGAKYNLDLPMIDLAGVNDPTLNFTYAYNCDYSAPFDTLKVLISNDCGSSWQTLFYKGGVQLRTTTYGLNKPFFPESGQWKNETISLTDFSGNVIIRFQDIEGSSNNLFLDDITIEEAVATKGLLTELTSIQIYPNPSNEMITITFAKLTGNSRLSIFNVSGEKVIEKQLTDNETQIDIRSLPQGVYFVRVQDEQAVQVSKMIKE